MLSYLTTVPVLRRISLNFSGFPCPTETIFPADESDSGKRKDQQNRKLWLHCVNMDYKDYCLCGDTGDMMDFFLYDFLVSVTCEIKETVKYTFELENRPTGARKITSSCDIDS